MAKIQIKVWAWRCERCNHVWQQRKEGEEPKVCPKCKSPYWNRPRKERKMVEGSG